MKICGEDVVKMYAFTDSFIMAVLLLEGIQAQIRMIRIFWA